MDKTQPGLQQSKPMPQRKSNHSNRSSAQWSPYFLEKPNHLCQTLKPLNPKTLTYRSFLWDLTPFQSFSSLVTCEQNPKCFLPWKSELIVGFYGFWFDYKNNARVQSQVQSRIFDRLMHLDQPRCIVRSIEACFKWLCDDLYVSYLHSHFYSYPFGVSQVWVVFVPWRVEEDWFRWPSQEAQWSSRSFHSGQWGKLQAGESPWFQLNSSPGYLYLLEVFFFFFIFWNDVAWY